MYSHEKTCALEEVFPFRHSSTRGHELCLPQILICKPETFPLPIKYCSHKHVWQPMLIVIIFSSHCQFLLPPSIPIFCLLSPLLWLPCLCSLRSLEQETAFLWWFIGVKRRRALIHHRISKIIIQLIQICPIQILCLL